MSFKFLFMSASVLGLCLAATAYAQSSPSPSEGVYGFGDSALEQGNYYDLSGVSKPPSPPYYKFGGFYRDSNGPVWIEKAYSGIQPFRAAGATNRLNFGFSGATTGRTNLDSNQAGTGLQDQIDLFSSRVASGAIKLKSGDMAFIDAGPNTIFESLLAQEPIESVMASGERGGRELAQAGTRLAKAGIDLVFINDFADAGLAPFLNGNPLARSLASQAALAGSQRLHQEVTRGRSQLETGQIVAIVQTRALVKAVVANPMLYGFKNVTEACYDDETGTLCANSQQGQSQYLFLDNAGHATEAGQTLLANYYIATVASFNGERQAELASMLAQEGQPLEQLNRIVRMRPMQSLKQGWRVYSFSTNSTGRGRASLQSAGEGNRFGLGFEKGFGAFNGGLAVARNTAQNVAGKLTGKTALSMMTLYGGWAGDGLYAHLGLQAGNGRINNLARNTAITGFTPTGRSRFEATGLDLEAGLNWRDGPFSFYQGLEIATSRNRIKPYRETGAEGLDISVLRLTEAKTSLSLRQGGQYVTVVADHALIFGLNTEISRNLSGKIQVQTDLKGSEAAVVKRIYRYTSGNPYRLSPFIAWEVESGIMATFSYDYVRGSHQTENTFTLSLSRQF